MSELIYMFASLAARTKNGVTCITGMRRLAETLHPHGVKITWLVSAESARLAADDLTAWHNEHQDDVAVMFPENLFPDQTKGSYDEKKTALSAEREGIQKALPWAKCSICACGHQEPQITRMLDELGFEGVWGFCWEQIDVDQITDRGCPWGFYFMDRDQRLRPAQGTGPVGMEWTARDLLKSFHSGNPCLYATDPNDVARGGICSWENIDYWKSIADNYLRNTRYNEHVFLLQHQEAHETERADGWLCYTEEDIRESLIMMDEFLKHLKNKIRIMTLHEAATLYRENYEHTASSYMLWEDAPIRRPNLDYPWSTPWGPWPKTFLHYDRGAQMMFIQGKVEPVCVRNYARPYAYGEFFAEPFIPRTRLIHNIRFNWSREIEIQVESPKAMPYGIALWDDYSLFQIKEAPGLVEGKILPRELLFLRYDLKEGKNTLKIVLEGK